MIVQATPDTIEAAAQVIRRGGLVAFPTETVYGLGAHALDPEAVARIYKTKGRPAAIPLIVHAADIAMARTLTAEWPATADRLAARFWPGPLTLVLKKAALVPDLVTAGLDSVGVRVPNHPVALELIRRAGVPIAAPSANRFTEISPTTARHVEQGLGDAVETILDGGQTTVGIESTVVALHRDPPAILRPGMISKSDLQAATGLPWETEQDRPHIVDAAESPGSFPRHYAPHTAFYLLQPGIRPRNGGRGRILELPSDPAGFAHALYAELHRADREGLDWIGIEQPPDAPEWAGILDRLARASAPREQ